MKSIVLALLLGACATVASTDAVTEALAPKIVTKATVSACLQKVSNRGVPPLSVVQDIIAEVKATPDSVFAVNENADIYSLVKPELGPYPSIKNRKAVMADVLIVLAGFESSWDYTEGRDLSASNTGACTMEAGMFQTSGNANAFSPTLGVFQKAKCGNNTCDGFRACAKAPGSAFKKEFTIGHTIRLLRFTTKHHGPLVRKEVNKWLSKSCVSQIEALL